MAKVTIESKEGHIKKAIIESTPEEKEQAEKLAVEKIKSRVKIKGFRPGKAPDHLIRAKFKEDFQEEVLKNILFMASFEIQEHDGVDIYRYLNVSDPQFGESSIKFDLEYEPDPYATLEKLKSFKLKEHRPVIGDKDIQAEIERALEGKAIYTEKSGGAEKGDRVTIDYEVWENDVPVGDPVEDVQVQLGENRFFEPIEKKLIENSVKAGDELTVTVEPEVKSEDEVAHPRDYIVKVKKVEKKELPELTDEIVKEIEPSCSTVEEFRKRMISELEKDFKHANEMGEVSQLIPKLVAESKFSFPETYADDRLMKVIRENNLTPEQVPEEDKEAYKKDLIERKKSQMVYDTLLNMAYRELKIESPPNDFREYVKSEYPESVADIILKIHDKLRKEEELSNQFEGMLIENAIAQYNAHTIFRLFEHLGQVKKGEKLSPEKLKKLYSKE